MTVPVLELRHMRALILYVNLSCACLTIPDEYIGPGCSFTVVGAGAAVWNGVPPARQFPFPLVQTTESNLRETGVYNRSGDGRWVQVQVPGHTGVHHELYGCVYN